jgi:hypothetical protein
MYRMVIGLLMYLTNTRYILCGEHFELVYGLTKTC